MSTRPTHTGASCRSLHSPLASPSYSIGGRERAQQHATRSKKEVTFEVRASHHRRSVHFLYSHRPHPTSSPCLPLSPLGSQEEVPGNSTASTPFYWSLPSACCPPRQYSLLVSDEGVRRFSPLFDRTWSLLSAGLSTHPVCSSMLARFSIDSKCWQMLVLLHQETYIFSLHSLFRSFFLSSSSLTLPSSIPPPWASLHSSSIDSRRISTRQQ